MVDKLRPGGGRPLPAPTARGTRGRPRSPEEGLTRLGVDIDAAHELAHELNQGSGKNSRENLAKDLAKLQQLSDTVNDAVAIASELKGSDRKQALGILSRSVAVLEQQLGRSPFGGALTAASENLAALLAHEGQSAVSAQPRVSRPLPPIPQAAAQTSQGPKAPPPIPPKRPLRPSATSDANAAPQAQARKEAATLSNEKEQALKYLRSLQDLPDGMRLSRANDTPEEKRLNRINYMNSLMSSAVYGGHLEGLVMSRLFGVKLYADTGGKEKPIEIGDGGHPGAPRTFLRYQSNAQNPRLSHYDAMIRQSDGRYEQVVVPGDGNCMFYSVAVALNYKDARAIVRAESSEELRALRQKFQARIPQKLAAGHSDVWFRSKLLEEIAKDLRGQVVRQLQTGHYDDAVDSMVIDSLAAR